MIFLQKSMMFLLIKNEMKKRILNIIFLLINNNLKQIIGILSQHINSKKNIFLWFAVF